VNIPEPNPAEVLAIVTGRAKAIASRKDKVTFSPEALGRPRVSISSPFARRAASNSGGLRAWKRSHWRRQAKESRR
jgi:hypothetical protein